MDPLPFQVLIVHRIVLPELLDIRNQDTRALFQVLFPSAEIVIIVQILQCPNLRRHAFRTPLKGIAGGLSICFQNIQPVRMNKGAELFQRMVHAYPEVFTIIQKLGDKENDLVGILFTPAFHNGLIHIGEDEGDGVRCGRRTYREIKPVFRFLRIEAGMHRLSLLERLLTIRKPDIAQRVQFQKLVINPFFSLKPRYIAVRVIDIYTAYSPPGCARNQTKPGTPHRAPGYLLTV